MAGQSGHGKILQRRDNKPVKTQVKVQRVRQCFPLLFCAGTGINGAPHGKCGPPYYGLETFKGQATIGRIIFGDRPKQVEIVCRLGSDSILSTSSEELFRTSGNTGIFCSKT